MDAETFFALFLLATALLVAGLAMAVRLLSPDRAAYRRGQADARAFQLRHDQMDSYRQGYNRQMYGHPDGPQLCKSMKTDPASAEQMEAIRRAIASGKISVG